MGQIVENADETFGKTGQGKAIEYLRGEDQKVGCALFAIGLIMAAAAVASQFVR